MNRNYCDGLVVSLMLLVALSSCNQKATTYSSASADMEIIKIKDDALFYNVYKIDSVNNYFLIYAKKNNSHYKIVSEKKELKCKEKIRINAGYRFSLQSIWTQEIWIGNINVSPSLTPHVTCLAFNDSTTICIERDSINDLFRAHNLTGLCISKSKGN